MKFSGLSLKACLEFHKLQNYPKVGEIEVKRINCFNFVSLVEKVVEKDKIVSIGCF